MSKLLALAGAAVCALTPAYAVSYTFDNDNQGWQYGDVALATVAEFGPAPWANGQIAIGDLASQTGVFAPVAVLGDQSAAYGGSISWQVADADNDGVPYAALILYGAGLNASIDLGPPSTDLSNLTTYTVTLTEASFTAFTGGYNSSGTALTQAQFQAILGNLQGIGFTTEYHSGGDDSRFDNAVFTGFSGATAAVPEPASWTMFIGGFGAVGFGLRRRRTSISFA